MDAALQATVNDIWDDEQLKARFRKALRFSGSVRSSEYHLTNACNLRCKGCWYFEFGFDQIEMSSSRAEQDRAMDDLIERELARGINTVLLIGGEPTLYPKRVARFVEKFDNVTISTNGMKALPVEGFENVTIGISIFGGLQADAELRGITPSGRLITDTIERAFDNYAHDDRAGFIYAVSDRHVDQVRPFVAYAAERGKRLHFNYYRDYSNPQPTQSELELLDVLLEARSAFPDTVASHPYFIHTMITGKSHWGAFGFDECPSVSVDFPGNAGRLAGKAPNLPLFNTVAADFKTVERCCTSGQCETCRDSQAMMSWLMVNLNHFRKNGLLQVWVEIVESFWSQFTWSPYHPARAAFV